MVGTQGGCGLRALHFSSLTSHLKFHTLEVATSFTISIQPPDLQRPDVASLVLQAVNPKITNRLRIVKDLFDIIYDRQTRAVKGEIDRRTRNTVLCQACTSFFGELTGGSWPKGRDRKNQTLLVSWLKDSRLSRECGVPSRRRAVVTLTGL